MGVLWNKSQKLAKFKWHGIVKCLFERLWFNAKGCKQSKMCMYAYTVHSFTECIINMFRAFSQTIVVTGTHDRFIYQFIVQNLLYVGKVPGSICIIFLRQELPNLMNVYLWQLENWCTAERYQLLDLNQFSFFGGFWIFMGCSVFVFVSWNLKQENIRKRELA